MILVNLQHFGLIQFHTMCQLKEQNLLSEEGFLDILSCTCVFDLSPKKIQVKKKNLLQTLTFS